MLRAMSDAPRAPSPDPRGFRTLRRRWRDAPAQEPPIPRAPGHMTAQLTALDADFDALLADPDFAAFMRTEGPRRLDETVARVARWRRAFSRTP